VKDLAGIGMYREELDFRGLIGEGRGVFPGQPEDGDFLGRWLVAAVA
jgi:hypothetical protein